MPFLDAVWTASLIVVGFFLYDTVKFLITHFINRGKVSREITIDDKHNIFVVFKFGNYAVYDEVLEVLKTKQKKLDGIILWQECKRKNTLFINIKYLNEVLETFYLMGINWR